MLYVLDACSMIAYLRDEKGSEVVEDALFAPDSKCYAHSVNLCEVFYDFYMAGARSEAEQAIEDILLLGVIEKNQLDKGFWQAVGKLKAEIKAFLADCFAIATANELNGSVLTSDHHEFDTIAKNGVCRVTFIR